MALANINAQFQYSHVVCCNSGNVVLSKRANKDLANEIWIWFQKHDLFSFGILWWCTLSSEISLDINIRVLLLCSAMYGWFRLKEKMQKNKGFTPFRSPASKINSSAALDQICCYDQRTKIQLNQCQMTISTVRIVEFDHNFDKFPAYDEHNRSHGGQKAVFDIRITSGYHRWTTQPIQPV